MSVRLRRDEAQWVVARIGYPEQSADAGTMDMLKGARVLRERLSEKGYGELPPQAYSEGPAPPFYRWTGVSPDPGRDARFESATRTPRGWGWFHRWWRRLRR